MEQENQKPTLFNQLFSFSNEQIKSLAEIAARLTLAIGISLYVLGLLVVNLYLNKHGISYFDLFRVNYIIAGTWLLLPLIAINVFYEIIIYTVSTPFSPDKNRTKNILERLLYLILCTLYLYFLHNIAKYFEIDIDSNWAAISFSGVAAFILARFYIKKFFLSKKIALSPTMAFYFVLILSSFTGYIFGFSRVLYPKIPSFVGGGNPSQVQLITNQSSHDQFKLSGVKFLNITESSNFIISDTLKLLLTTENEYFLLLKNDTINSAISVRRDLVNMVLYLPKKK